MPFNGESTYAVSENAQPLNLKAFTISAWVTLQRVDRLQIFVSRGGSTEQFTLYLYQQWVRMLVENRPGKYLHADAPLPQAGQWTHYAGTYDGQQITLYVNGKLAAAVKAPGEMPPSEAPLFLGGLGVNDRNLAGRLEDLRIYARVLRAEEVAALTAPGDGPTEKLLARWTSASLEKENWRNTVGREIPPGTCHRAGNQP